MPMNGALWVTKHTGKMTGIDSISTSSMHNPNCIVRREVENSICSKCYAFTYLKMRNNLKEHLVENTNILSSRMLREIEIPMVRSKFFRFESFGDLCNTTHLKNYLLICEANPDTTFSLYTKNVYILDLVFNVSGHNKPDNLIIVVSSPTLNKQLDLSDEYKWLVDHIFTVYDKRFISENNVNINCGAKSCISCLRCYKRDTDFYINEKLK